MKKHGHMPQTDLPAWVDSLQSKGFYFFTRKGANDTLDVSEVALKQAATRLIKKNRIVRILGGFYIIVPLEYLSTGMLPAEWFISDLMKYVEQPFYVGLLSAALDREYEKLGYDIGNDTYCDYYVRQPFHREPDFGVISVNYNFDELIARAEEPKLYRCL